MEAPPSPKISEFGQKARRETRKNLLILDERIAIPEQGLDPKAPNRKWSTVRLDHRDPLSGRLLKLRRDSNPR